MHCYAVTPVTVNCLGVLKRACIHAPYPLCPMWCITPHSITPIHWTATGVTNRLYCVVTPRPKPDGRPLVQACIPLAGPFPVYPRAHWSRPVYPRRAVRVYKKRRKSSALRLYISRPFYARIVPMTTPDPVPNTPIKTPHQLAYERYRKSPKGLAARARARAKYQQTPGYFLSRENAKSRRQGRTPGQMFANDEEFKAYRLAHNLPWPVPADEYAKQQEAIKRAQT